MSHYNKSIIPFLTHITEGISQIRRHERISSLRSCMSRKGSARRAARAMAIDGLSYCLFMHRAAGILIYRVHLVYVRYH